MKSVTASIAFLISLSFSAAFAQDRFYSWSDQFETGEAGDLELESYSNFNTPSFSDNNHYLNQQFELEYGLSHNLSFGVNQTLGKEYPGGNFSLGQFGVEGLYRLTAPGKFVVDPVLYIEYSRMWDRSASNQLEAKLILTKDFGRLNAIVNCAAEHQFGTASELEPEFSGGISYEFARGLRGGIEMFATGPDQEQLPDADLRGTGAGPTVSLTTPWFWVTSGISYGIANEANRLNFRAIIGIDL